MIERVDDLVHYDLPVLLGYVKAGHPYQEVP
jgi:hypothetical protein